MQIKLSVVILTLNEEKHIKRCIQSVQPVADEILIIDSFSTDETEEICKALDVKFIKHKFEGYIEQKNYAITQASSPYILSLDADEELSVKLQEKILAVKSNWQYDGYSMNRLNNYCGKWIRHTGWYPDKKLRLWNSRKGKWVGINPHDRFELKPGSKINHINADILHYSYSSISEHLNQMNKFTSISAREKYEKGKKIPLLLTIIRMLAVFIKKYFIKLGFLDGYYGFIISCFTVYYTFIKDIKLKELYKKNIKDTS